MNTYAIQPVSPFIPVLFIRANTASEALNQVVSAIPAVGVWQVRTQPIN